MKKTAAVIIYIILHGSTGISQPSHEIDSVVRALMNEPITSQKDEGRTMMLQGNLSAAGSYYDNALNKDEDNKEAYFNRGIVHLVTNDTLNACRDWSAVLALGDTATYKLLEQNCHSTMYIEDDVIPESKYRKLYGHSTERQAARTVVEEMPVFPGGEQALMKHLAKVNYPAAARAKQIEGTVYVRFTISSKGTVLYPHIMHGIGSGCDEEALRIVKSLPTWKPGKENGKPVLVTQVLPVKFRIK